MDPTNQELLNAVATWGYPAMLVLMIIEGPITTITAAFLASLGFFNLGIVLMLSILGDVIGDIILYTIGYTGGRPALLKAEKVLKVKESIVERLQHKFQQKGPRIIFAVKATTGLCWITFILAGAVRMNFWKFVIFTLLGGIIWSAFLVVLGYFFGYAAELLSTYIAYAGLILFVIAVASVIGINLIRKKQADKIIE